MNALAAIMALTTISVHSPRRMPDLWSPSSIGRASVLYTAPARAPLDERMVRGSSPRGTTSLFMFNVIASAGSNVEMKHV